MHQVHTHAYTHHFDTWCTHFVNCMDTIRHKMPFVTPVCMSGETTGTFLDCAKTIILAFFQTVKERSVKLCMTTSIDLFILPLWPWNLFELTEASVNVSSSVYPMIIQSEKIMRSILYIFLFWYSTTREHLNFIKYEPTRQQFCPSDKPMTLETKVTKNSVKDFVS